MNAVTEPTTTTRPSLNKYPSSPFPPSPISALVLPPSASQQPHQIHLVSKPNSNAPPQQSPPLYNHPYLGRNEIVRVRPLRKVMWPKLRVLVISTHLKDQMTTPSQMPLKLSLSAISHSFNSLSYRRRYLSTQLVRQPRLPAQFLPTPQMPTQNHKIHQYPFPYPDINSQQRISQLKIEGQL